MKTRHPTAMQHGPATGPGPFPRRESGITREQMRALFAAAARATLTVEELRAMTPHKSISRMTIAEASALLDRLNHGTAHAKPRPSPQASPLKSQASPRRPAGIATFVTDGQKLMIDSLRLELGWTPDQLRLWLDKRHYRNDPARPMSQIHSSADGVAVIELLKAVRDRTYAAHRPPHPRQDDTLTHVKARLRHERKQTPGDFAAWWQGLRHPDGRYLHSAATTRDLSAAIELATRELAKARAAKCGTGGTGVSPVSPGTGVPPASPSPEGAA